MISQPLEYDADETKCDHCGQPTPRLTPHAAIDLCDECYRIAERNEAIVLRYLRSDEPAWLRMVNPLHGWGEDTGK